MRTVCPTDWVITMRQFCLILGCSVLTSGALAADGKLLATSGLLSIEGSAGGGLTPWAVIAGYGEADQWGATAAISQTSVQDFRLNTAAVAAGWRNRIELSLARQRFELPSAISQAQLSQTIVGAKVRLAGDLIYERWPQVSLGVQFKNNTAPELLGALGVSDRKDVDYTLSVSRLFLDGPFSRNFLLNLGLRSTKAHQIGLLGFGAERETVFEGSAATLINRSLAVGVEFRQKPDTLLGLREQHWRDVFIAWFPNKHFSLALAYVDLGRVANTRAQDGYFFTLQGSF